MCFIIMYKVICEAQVVLIMRFITHTDSLDVIASFNLIYLLFDSPLNEK